MNSVFLRLPADCDNRADFAPARLLDAVLMAFPELGDCQFRAPQPVVLQNGTVPFAVLQRNCLLCGWLQASGSRRIMRPTI